MQAAPSTDQPTLPKPHRPKKLVSRSSSPHLERNDGVALSAPTPTDNRGSVTPANDVDTPEAAASRRRRPRKLNRPPKSVPASATPTPREPPSSNVEAPIAEPSLKTEISSLEMRVKNLEGQVSELYQRPSSTSSRSSRRRGRGGNRVQDAASGVTGDGDEQMNATPEKESIRKTSRPKNFRADSDPGMLHDSPGFVKNDQATPGEEAEEEVPRVYSPTAEVGQDASMQRPLTLTGSYKIPLPSGVSLNDVRNIQSGISTANNIARTLIEARRASSTDTQLQRTRSASVDDLTSGKQSWGDWISGHSLSIVKLMNKIEGEAAVEASGQQSSAKPPKQAQPVSRKPSQGVRKPAVAVTRRLEA